MGNSVVEFRNKDRERFGVNSLVLGLFFGVASQLRLRHARLAAHVNLGERRFTKFVERKHSFF